MRIGAGVSVDRRGSKRESRQENDKNRKLIFYSLTSMPERRESFHVSYCLPQIQSEYQTKCRLKPKWQQPITPTHMGSRTVRSAENLTYIVTTKGVSQSSLNVLSLTILRQIWSHTAALLQGYSRPIMSTTGLIRDLLKHVYLRSQGCVRS